MKIILKSQIALLVALLFFYGNIVFAGDDKTAEEKDQNAIKQFEKLLIQNLDKRIRFKLIYQDRLIKKKEFRVERNSFDNMLENSILEKELGNDFVLSLSSALGIVVAKFELFKKIKALWNNALNVEYEKSEGKNKFYAPLEARSYVKEEGRIDFLENKLQAIRNIPGLKNEESKFQEEILLERQKINSKVSFRSKFGVDLLPNIQFNGFSKVSASNLLGKVFLETSAGRISLRLYDDFPVYQRSDLNNGNKIGFELQKDFSDQFNGKIGSSYEMESKKKDYFVSFWKKINKTTYKTSLRYSGYVSSDIEAVREIGGSVSVGVSVGIAFGSYYKLGLIVAF